MAAFSSLIAIVTTVLELPHFFNNKVVWACCTNIKNLTQMALIHFEKNGGKYRKKLLQQC